MTENPTTSCSRCGTVISAEAAGGLCPRCLMALNFDSRTMPEGEEPPHAPILTPDELAEKFPQYEILECLGRGGMGVVYKARQKSLDRIVAIKILPPERVGEARFSDRFAIEAATLARLSHPNIVTVHDFGETGGLFYIVMEYVDGVNLRDLLREGKLEAKQALAIVPPICDALQYAHDKGIVHRDIKPENLLLDKDGRVKIADFGIASLMGAAGEIAGTPPYMAPEQNGRSTDHRADIYALGVVLYEMLTGERPGKELVAPSRKVQIDVRLDEMVLRALEKEPERRYQTANQFRTVVETMAAPPSVSADESGRRKKRRKKVIFRFLDPLPDKHELLRMALTMLIAGVVIIALMDGAWDKAREWIEQASDPKHSVEERIATIGLVVACIAIITALVWKLPRWLIKSSENPADARSTHRRPIIAALVLTVILVAAYKQLWPSRAYPSSSTSSAYQAPVIGRISFECSHAEAVAGGSKGSSFDVKAWGDTQWKPFSGHGLSLEGGRTISFKTRVDACRSNPPVAMVTASLNGKDWETRKIELRPEPPAQSLDFTNGLRVTVRWSPIEVADPHAKSPDPIQQDVMRRGSELADLEHPLTTLNSPQSFGPVIERELRVNEQTLLQGLDLETGKVLTLTLEEFNRVENFTDARRYRSKEDWIKAKGVDMVVAAGEKGFGIAGLVTDFKLGALPVVAWDTATESDLKKALERTLMESDGFLNGLKIPTDPPLPMTYALRSGDKLGLLQITARLQNPDGIRLRYKLVTAVKATAEAVDAATSALDQEHPLTTSASPQSFGPAIERVVHEMESGLGNEALRLESGELFSLPQSKTNEWLGETSASLLIGKTGIDFQLIIHKGILRDMNNAEWDHGTPKTFWRAMEKGPGMMKPGKSEKRWAAYDWTGGKLPATFGFHLASRAQGMLQVLGDTPDGTGLSIRYKLLPGPNGETILPPDFERVRDRATAIARRHYPDFKITMDGDRIIMQRNLREYEIHNPSKSGDVSAETHKETGPAADGFQLVLEPITKEPATQAIQLASQADGPQLLDRPYWKGFVDHRFDPGKNSGVSMFFDFGPAVKAEFKDEMMRLLEK